MTSNDPIARNLQAVKDTIAPGWGKFGETTATALPAPFASGYKTIAGLSAEKVDYASVAIEAYTFTTSCGSMIGELRVDPLKWLINNGLSFLINIFTPLKQAIDLVTGNPDALKASATQFAAAGKSIRAASKELLDTAKRELKDWEGAAADAAKRRLGEFAAGMDGTAGRAGEVAQMLHLSAVVMKAAEDFIKGLLIDLVEWVIITWIAATASAALTLGGSTAVASAMTTAKVAKATTEAATKVSRLTSLINKVREIFAKITAALKRAKDTSLAKFMDSTGAGGKAVDKTLRGYRKDHDLGTRAEVSTIDALAHEAGPKIVESLKKRAADSIGLEYNKTDGTVGIAKRRRADGEEVPDRGKILRKAGGMVTDAGKGIGYNNDNPNKSDDQIKDDLDI